jgi:Ca2+-binding EF-hand superfamily protein
MFSNPFESKISELLLTIAECERDVEITRQVLTENKEYSSFQIFYLLDSEKKNAIDEYDIINFLKRKNIYSSPKEAKLLILYYDHNLDKKLDFKEFLSLIESQISCEKMGQLKEVSSPICFSVDYALTKLLEKEIIYARKIINLFEDLRGYPEFDIHDIFHIIKGNNHNNVIVTQNVINFLNKNYASFIDQDVDLIFKRIDLDVDGAIDLCEFHIFFGFPNCGYSCPFIECENCEIECCDFCALEGPCLVHKFINNCKPTIKKKVHRTYYTEFDNNNKNEGIESIESKRETKKISDNLFLKISPSRKYAPIEVCIRNSNPNNDINNKKIEKINLFKYKNLNKENPNLMNTINQNFTKNSFGKDITIKNKEDNKIDMESIDNKENQNNNYQTIPQEEQKYGQEQKKDKLNEDIINNEEEIIRMKSYPKATSYEEGQFIDYLNEAMKQECKIEQLKIELSLRSDFNWEKIFRVFELEGRGYLTKEDIILGLNKFGIYPKDLDISLLLNRYDLNKEGIISYPIFFELIVPISKYHRLLVDNRKILEKNKIEDANDISIGTKECIKNLFIGIFNGELILNKLKESYTSLKIKFNDIFKKIDKDGKGYIGEEDLASYMKDNNIFVDSREFDLIFLRLNKERNGKIKFNDICNEIEPF